MRKSDKNFDRDFLAALEALRAEEKALSATVLFAISDVTQKELEEFAATWVSLGVERRRRVAQAMVELAEEHIEADFNRLFRYLLDDEDAAVRALAINGLWEDEDAALVNPLLGFMRSDAAAQVRAAAAESLGRFVLFAETQRLAPESGAQIREALLAVIRSGTEDDLVRRRAIEALAYIGDETMRDIIASAYANDDAEMRATALFAMGRSADPYWRRTAAQELYSPEPQLRYEAARALGELGFKAAVPRLIELLDDAEAEVQVAAIGALGALGGKDARAALLGLLEGDDEALRDAAQDALDELEFARGSEMLLYDMGVSTAEAAMLETDLDQDEFTKEEE